MGTPASEVKLICLRSTYPCDCQEGESRSSKAGSWWGRAEYLVLGKLQKKWNFCSCKSGGLLTLWQERLYWLKTVFDLSSTDGNQGCTQWSFCLLGGTRAVSCHTWQKRIIITTMTSYKCFFYLKALHTCPATSMYFSYLLNWGLCKCQCKY